MRITHTTTFTHAGIILFRIGGGQADQHGDQDGDEEQHRRVIHVVEVAQEGGPHVLLAALMGRIAEDDDEASEPDEAAEETSEESSL